MGFLVDVGGTTPDSSRANSLRRSARIGAVAAGWRASYRLAAISQRKPNDCRSCAYYPLAADIVGLTGWRVPVRRVLQRPDPRPTTGLPKRERIAGCAGGAATRSRVRLSAQGRRTIGRGSTRLSAPHRPLAGPSGVLSLTHARCHRYPLSVWTSRARSKARWSTPIGGNRLTLSASPRL